MNAENIRKVLMVDDDPAIRRITEISLSKVGHWQVVLADCGQTALEVAAREKPDLILLDVMMPGMNGPTTFKLLQDQGMTPNPPVIFMTAKVLRQEIDSYRELGAAGVISKPFDPMTLPSQIIDIVATLTCPIENLGSTLRSSSETTSLPSAQIHELTGSYVHR